MKDLPFKISAELLQTITSEQAFYYNIIPKHFDNESITLYAIAKFPEKSAEELAAILGKKVFFEYINQNIFNVHLNTNYRKAEKDTGETLTYSTDFLDRILLKANLIGSSDIHFEPYEQVCRVRFRLDGKLTEQYHVSHEEYPILINKIKIKANLDISEKRLPQDGRITITTGTQDFDIRVSSLPILHGEKLVLRILSKDTGNISLNNLGFSENELSTYKRTIKKPNGIILISGPTGSGKTTTLYATLKELNDAKTNILTIEDPIEYTLDGINQVQLKEHIGLDFSSTLKTFLRQDPDIIMVGEIRDINTANMAIRAALTGHLVLSTIHTNSAWGTISRLIDMRIPPFLIANTLNISIAQRLVRLLCEYCKEEKTFLMNDKVPTNFISSNDLQTHYISKGCSHCHFTGYKGRRAIYELLPNTNKLMDYIKNNQLQIDSFIESENIKTLKQNALRLVKEGKTSIEEVYPLLSN